MLTKTIILKNNLFAILLGLLVAVSCKNMETPLTENEVKDFAKKLEISIAKRDPSFFDNAVDKRALLRKSGLKYSKASEEKIKMGTVTVSSLSEKGTFQRVKQYKKDGIWHVLFRLYADAGLNYYDLELGRSKNEVKVVDGYAYHIGQNFSQVFMDLNDQMDEVESNTKENKDKWLDLVGPMRKLTLEGKNQEALTLFETIPEDIRKIKLMQIIHVMICSGIDADSHDAALKEYKNLYPNEPNVALLQLAGGLLREDPEETLLAVEALDKMIDTDPFLDYYRHLSYYLKKDLTHSIQYLEQLMKNFPSFEDGMIELIAVYIEDKNKASAGPWIEKFRTHNAFDQERLETFLTSKGY